jgi:hypothetical protein
MNLNPFLHHPSLLSFSVQYFPSTSSKSQTFVFFLLRLLFKILGIGEIKENRKGHPFLFLIQKEPAHLQEMNPMSSSPYGEHAESMLASTHHYTRFQLLIPLLDQKTLALIWFFPSQQSLQTSPNLRASPPESSK